MTISLRRSFRLLLISLGIVSIFTSGAYAKKRKSRIKPIIVKQIKKTNKSFFGCKKQATEDFKDEFINKKQYALALTTCKERYPGANLYISCKLSALKKFKKDPSKKSKALKSCKNFQIATMFDPKRKIPFFTYRRSLFFAGIGMNKAIPAATLSPPNFDCKNVKSAIKDLSKANYLPFGGSPSTFKGMGKLKTKLLTKLFKRSGLATLDEGLVYFPVASCDFVGNRGKGFKSLSAYYILDPKNKTAIPYFAVAHYNKGKKLTVKNITARFGNAFGTQYKPNIFKEIPHVTYLSAKPMNTSLVDSGGEPKDLCETPRSHYFVAAISGHKESPKQGNYLLVANIAAMCSYGDKIIRRLGKKK